jgi:hypothetical protein
MRTFTQITEHLKITRPEWGRRMRALAARFHLGVESEDDLYNRTYWTPVYRQTQCPPTLSRAEMDAIIDWRKA